MRKKLWSALSLATATLMGCADGCTTGVPEYGVPVVDGDGDGWFEHQDCDDDQPTVHPEADEICDDAVDNDCDGQIDGADVDCEAPERPLWAGLSRAAARALGVLVGETGDTGSAVSDYSGWGADRDEDGWSVGEDPDDRDPTVVGGTAPPATR